MKVKRVSKYTIKRSHQLFNYCDNESFKAKNLRNLANYHIRQCFMLSSKDNKNLSNEQKDYLLNINKYIDLFNVDKEKSFKEKKPIKIKKAEAKLLELKLTKDNSKKHKDEIKKKEKDLEKLKASEFKPQKYIDKNNGLLTYDFLDYYFSKCLKSEDNPYKLLAIQTSQQILRNLFKDWKSFRASIKDYKKDKSKYTGRPKLPRYKAKNGRVKLSMTNQSCKVKDGYITLPKTTLKLEIGFKTDDLELKEVRIVPMGGSYKIELVWDKEIQVNTNLNKEYFIGIDLGLNNLATIVNNIGLSPIIINGKPLKAINQYYNKKLSLMKEKLPFYTFARYDKEKNIYVNEKRQLSNSKKIESLTLKRNAKIEDYMHKVSSFIIQYCLDNNIGNIVIGKNEDWKREINIGKQNNQNFVSIPFNKLLIMISYKAENIGICVHIVEESYTSKASFLNLDELPTYDNDNNIKHKFSGIRIKRGLYKTGSIVINADVNGSYNILRKYDNNIFTKENIDKFKIIPKDIKINGYLNKKKPA